MPLQKTGIRLEADNAAAFFSTLAKASTALATLGDASTRTSRDIGQLARSSKEITLDRLNRQLDDQRTRLGIAAQKLGELTTKYGAASVQVQTHEAALNKLAGQMGETQDRILLTERQITAEAAAAASAVSSNQSMERALRQLAGTADDTGGAMGAMSQIVIGGLRKIGELGVEALGSVAGGLKNFAVSSVTAAGDFEASLNRFASVTGASMQQAGYELADFKELFLQLGAATQFSSTQAAEAANELAKGGVAIPEIMGEATQATLDLAAAGELDLAPAATIVAKQLGVWSDTGISATRITDLLAQSANASTVDVDDLALGLANVGGRAHAMGISFDDVVTTLGAIAPGFSSASTAGTSFNNFLARLNPTTEAARDAMADLGLYSEETGSAFFDAQGQFVGMQESSQLLADALSVLTVEQRNTALQIIFSNDAMGAAIGLAGLGAAGYEDFAASMDLAGSAADQAAARNQGFNFALESLGGSLETLKIRLGDKLLPTLTDFINNGLIPATNWLADRVGPAIDDFSTGLGTAIDRVKTVAGFISDLFIPILAGASAALVAYTIAQTAAFIGSVGGLASFFNIVGAGLGLITARAVTAAGAFGSLTLAMLPYAAIAASITVPIMYMNKLTDAATAQTAQIRENSTAWNEGIDALERYRAAQERATGAVREQGAEQAKELERLIALRDEKLKRATGDGSANWLSAAFDSDEIVQAHIAEIKELDSQIAALTATTNTSAAEMTQATQQQNQAIGQSLAGLRSLREGTDEVTGAVDGFTTAVQFSDEQLAEFAETTERASTAGRQVFGDMEGSFEGHVASMAVLQEQYNQARTNKEREGLREQMNAQIIAYAEQEQVQRESLGRQLIALAEVEGQKAGLSSAKITEMTDALRTEYGIRQTIEEQAWGSSAATIQEWADTGGGEIDTFIGKLNQTTDSTLETQRALAEMEGTYEFFLKENLGTEVIPDQETFLSLMREVPTEKTMTLFQNFLDGTLSADEFLKAVNAIPASKTVNIHTSYTSSGTPPPSKGGAEARASGGAVVPGKHYSVAEEGWEFFRANGQFGVLGEDGAGFFSPTEPGMIYSHQASLNMLANGTPQQPQHTQHGLPLAQPTGSGTKDNWISNFSMPIGFAEVASVHASNTLASYTPPATPGQILGSSMMAQNTENNYNLTIQTAPDPRGAVERGFRLMQVWGGY